MDDFRLSLSLCSHLLHIVTHTLHNILTETVVWSDVCRSRFRPIFVCGQDWSAFMEFLLWLHGGPCHPVCPLLVDKSSRCVCWVQPFPTFAAVILNFFKLIWHWLESVSSAHLPWFHWEQRICLGRREFGIRMTWQVNQSWSCITRVQMLFMLASCRENTHILTKA